MSEWIPEEVPPFHFLCQNFIDFTVTVHQELKQLRERLEEMAVVENARLKSELDCKQQEIDSVRTLRRFVALTLSSIVFAQSGECCRSARGIGDQFMQPLSLMGFR